VLAFSTHPRATAHRHRATLATSPRLLVLVLLLPLLLASGGL